MRSRASGEQLAVKEKTAAAMLDMSTKDFLRLVAEGALPPPVQIGSIERWRVDMLRAVLDGNAARPEETFVL